MLFLKIRLLNGKMCIKEPMGPAGDSHEELCNLATFPPCLRLPWSECTPYLGQDLSGKSSHTPELLKYW